MHVLVLGAGLLGVSTAHFLQQQGHTVTVVDRQAAAAAETSFDNGGQISVSHAEPWANPGAPLKLLQWLGRDDAPLLFRLRADMRQWLWGLSFLRNCTPARTRHNIEQIVSLGTYSRSVLQQLRALSTFGLEMAVAMLAGIMMGLAASQLPSTWRAAPGWVPTGRCWRSGPATARRSPAGASPGC
jgi:glycine/D-amino acid oxidase-like deaminating enzyme